MKKSLLILLVLLLGIPAVFGQAIARDPYNGAIVMDAATGEVLFEDGADRPGYPASMLKLMTLFVVLDRIEAGHLRLTDIVPVTKEAMRMGGSQVWLDPRESFPVEELLYALMVQSANDAAMALAIYIGGSRDGFVAMMNDKAAELGLSPITRFQSPHGLPPADKTQRPDMTTPRDFARLCKALLDAHPDTLRYTSVQKREFRANAQPPFKPILMETHNRLLGTVPGCDGLKTGWIRASGYCIAATAMRDDRRVIAVVMGSVNRSTRDAKTVELINRWLPEAVQATTVSAAKPAPAPAPVPEAAAKPHADAGEGAETESAAGAEEGGGGGWAVAGWMALAVFVLAVAGLSVRRRLFLSR
jgi:D-alanyl-D-alanine carboxypeptidase (penicillin-binding protein 5/6)